MAAVSFDMTFTYVAAGWEGSASDQAVLRWAITNGGFSVPEGKRTKRVNYWSAYYLWRYCSGDKYLFL